MAKQHSADDQRTPTDKPDFSHLMITSVNSPLSASAMGARQRVMTWDGHPIEGDGPISISNAPTTTTTAPAKDNMNQYPSNQAWVRAGSMSLDGLFVPYSTNFAIVNEGGQALNINQPPIASAMPSFERPMSIAKEDKAHDRIAWVGAGKDSGLGAEAPGPPFISSVSLNPFASGNNIQMVNKNTKQVHPHLNVGGYAKHSSNLTAGQETSTETDRPVGLRGPLVMAGWGYDTHGMPTPNMRFESEYRYNEPGAANYGRQRYVPPQMKAKTINGMQTDWAHFIPQHMRRPDKWKVGPIDLRWDRERKVWVGGKFNGIFLSKATRCILPEAGVDGNNSFNFGVGGNVNAPGRLYRNPCPTNDCNYTSYFPTSIYYPDIEIYDPEDHNWCGRCMTLGHITACGDFKDGCSPFYDAIALRPIDEWVGDRKSKGARGTECTDKFRKIEGGAPQMRRAGNPCHGWGSSYFGEREFINEKIGKEDVWTQEAKAMMYQKIFIENPLGQGLMVGDAFFSYDTGRRIVYEYERTVDPTCGQTASTKITVKEMIPIHIILQAEFFGMEIITHAGCDRGEMAACSQKFFAQGFATGTDCGPDDDYPQTAGI